MKNVLFKIKVNKTDFRIIQIEADQHNTVYRAQVKNKNKRYSDIGEYAETEDHAYYWLAQEMKRYAE